jgi:uracil phosphoribosyltransferase
MNPGCQVVDHPLVRTKVAVLRARETPRESFRRTLRELTALVAFEATRDLAVREVEVETPLAVCPGHILASEIVVVPILRAGLGMAEALLDVLPQARVGHVGMYRDEKTFEPRSYYFKAPPDLDRAEVFLVDPMLATGQSASDAATELKRCGVKNLRLMALVGCRPGVELFRKNHPDVSIFLAALDPGLNERAYIVPGLGDAGDRYFGT